MKKILLLSSLFTTLGIVDVVRCMQIDEIKLLVERDLNNTRVISPADEPVKEAEKMRAPLELFIKSPTFEAMTFIDFILPNCGRYRAKAELVAFDEVPGVSKQDMLAYQIAMSSYYNACASVMSSLIKTLFLQMAKPNE